MCVRESLVLGMVKVGSNSAQNGAQFVDESAIEIDVAGDVDDDDVYEMREIRVDSASTLGSLGYQIGDQIVDNELTKYRSLQFEASVPGKVFGSELISHPMTFAQTETCPDLSFHKPQKDGREDTSILDDGISALGEIVQKVPNDSSTTNDHFVDESAVVIDVADDDSVVVITDDSDSEENTGRSVDSLNLPENSAGSHDSVVSDLQEGLSSQQSSSPAATDGQSSTDIATVSLDKIAPGLTPPPAVKRPRRTRTPESCDEDLLLEYNLRPLKTALSPDSATSPKIMLFDESDVEHLQKPFTCGWRRELVCRRNSKDRICDVYYKSPEGKKLRSKVEIAAYLNSVPESPVNLTHFTFKRVLLFCPPIESVRLAFSRRPRKPASQSSSPEKKPKSQDCSTAGHVSTKPTPSEHLFTASTVGATGPLDSLSSVTAESCVVGQEVAQNIDRLSTLLLNIPEPVLLPQPENVTLDSEKPTLNIRKKRYRKRMHESSPE